MSGKAAKIDAHGKAAEHSSADSVVRQPRHNDWFNAQASSYWLSAGLLNVDIADESRTGAKTSRPLATALAAVVRRPGGHRMSRKPSRTSPRHRRRSQRRPTQRFDRDIHRRASDANPGRGL